MRDPVLVAGGQFRPAFVDVLQIERPGPFAPRLLPRRAARRQVLSQCKRRHARAERLGPLARNVGIAVDQLLIPEPIGEVDSKHVREVRPRLADQTIEAVRDDPVVFRERVGAPVAVAAPAELFLRRFVHPLGGPICPVGVPIAPRVGIEVRRTRQGDAVPQRDFRLREANVRRKAGDRRRAVDPLGGVEQDHRPAAHAMVRSGDRNDLLRARNRAGFPNAVRGERVVAEVDPHVRPVRADRPEVLIEDGVAVDVVPARVENPPVIQDRRIPFVRFVERDRIDRFFGRGAGRSAGLHQSQRVNVARAASTTVVAAPPSRNEHHPAVGEAGRVEVIETAAGQFLDAASIGRHFVNVIVPVHGRRIAPALGRTLRLAEREVDSLAIERDVRMHEIARRKPPCRQRSRVHRLARLVEDKNPAARTRRVTVDLGQLVAHRRRDVFHQQERADVEQRVLQDQGAANLVHLGPGPLPVQRLALAGGRDPRLEGRPPLGQRAQIDLLPAQVADELVDLRDSFMNRFGE